MCITLEEHRIGGNKIIFCGCAEKELVTAVHIGSSYFSDHIFQGNMIFPNPGIKVSC